MQIDFNQIEEACYLQFKGGEKELYARMFFDGSVRVMKGRLMPNASIGEHTHTDSSEIIFITEGTGCVRMDGEIISLHSGDCHYCPKGHTHSLINNSNAELCFTAVVPQQ